VVGPADLPRRVVEVLAISGEDGGETWTQGSGLIIGPRLVLTAAHVLTAEDIYVRTFDPSPNLGLPMPKAMWPATVRIRGNAVAVDLALIEIRDSDDRSADEFDDLSFLRLATIDRHVPHADALLGCTAVGFPRFMEVTNQHSDPPIRETAHIEGHVPVLSGMATGFLALRVEAAPRALSAASYDLDASEWSGISGAVVVRDDLVIGVITRHQPAAGSQELWLTPVTAFNHCVEEADRWWKILRTSPKEVVTLPEPRLVTAVPMEAADRALRYYLTDGLRAACHVALHRQGPLEFDPTLDFVPLAARWEDGASTTNLLLDLLDRLSSDHSARLAITGNYGQGKTFLAWALALTLSSKRERSHLPVMIPLRCLRTDSRDPPSRQILNYLNSHFPAVEWEDLLGGRERTAVLILDAADEIITSPGTASSLPDFTRMLIEQVRSAFPGSATIVTFRTGLFASHEEPSKVLSEHHLAYLELWTSAQFELLAHGVSKRGLVALPGGWMNFCAAVADRPLADLTARPLWCRMIIESRESILDSPVSNEAMLFDHYVGSYFRRNQEQSGHSQQLLVDEKRRVLELLTVEMAQAAGVIGRSLAQAVQITQSEISRVVEREFNTYSHSQIEVAIHDLQTYSLLDTISFELFQYARQERFFTFRHVSLQYYFQGAALRRVITTNLHPAGSGIGPAVEEIARLCMQIERSEDALAFAVGLIQNDAALLNVQVLLRLDPLTTFGSLSVAAKAIRRTLSILWLRSFRIRYPTTPVDMTGFVLARLDLSRMDLRNVRFAHADLTGCSFVNSDLRWADFTAADCRNANFTASQRDGAVFTGAKLDGGLGL
jgi:hypothetical protein